MRICDTSRQRPAGLALLFADFERDTSTNHIAVSVATALWVSFPCAPRHHSLIRSLRFCAGAGLRSFL